MRITLQNNVENVMVNEARCKGFLLACGLSSSFLYLLVSFVPPFPKFSVGLMGYFVGGCCRLLLLTTLIKRVGVLCLCRIHSVSLFWFNFPLNVLLPWD